VERRGDRQRETDASDRRSAAAHSEPPYQKHALALNLIRLDSSRPQCPPPSPARAPSEAALEANAARPGGCWSPSACWPLGCG